MPTRAEVQEIESAVSKCLIKKEYLDTVASAVGNTVNSRIMDLISNLTEQINELKSEIQELRNQKNEVIVLKTELDRVKEENASLTQALEEKQEMLEQYTRRNSIRVFGVTEDRHEDCEEKVLKLFRQKLNVNISPDRIDNCHRTGKYIQDGKRGIIVKFATFKDKMEIFKNKRMLKGTGVIVTEDLTKERVRLLKTARDAHDVNNVWTHLGRICVKIDNKIYTVNNARGYNKLPNAQGLPS